MSKTFRRKQLNGDERWLYSEWVSTDGTWKNSSRKPLAYNHPSLVEEITKYHSDAYRNFKEPGPASFRNLMTERPQRRFAENELRKFMLNEGYEVILNSKNLLEYWT